MAITALFLFIGGVLIGGVLGFRFKVLVLIPAIILTMIVTGSIEVAQRPWPSALTTLAAVIAIQVGYLGGIAACVVVDHAVTLPKKLSIDRS
jgi:hypothetical protein